MHALRSASGTVFIQVVCALSFSAVAACSGASQSSSSGSTSEESQALSASASSEATFETQASQCASAFQTCVSAASADVAACVATLEKCLPDVPPPGPGCGLWDDGGVPTPPTAPDAAVPTSPGQPPPTSGAQITTDAKGDADAGSIGGEPGQGGGHAAPPSGGGAMGDAGCDKGQGGGGSAGHGDPLPPYCAHVPLPKSPALEACRKTLESCMQAATDDADRKACLDADHACVKDAFETARASGN